MKITKYKGGKKKKKKSKLKYVNSLLVIDYLNGQFYICFLFEMENIVST